jgi:hypothetical protein
MLFGSAKKPTDKTPAGREEYVKPMRDACTTVEKSIASLVLRLC